MWIRAGTGLSHSSPGPHSAWLQPRQHPHRPGAKMKSRACRSAAATLGCQRSTMKTTRGPSSAEPGEEEHKGVRLALAHSMWPELRSSGHGKTFLPRWGMFVRSLPCLRQRQMKGKRVGEPGRAVGLSRWTQSAYCGPRPQNVRP